MTDQNKLPQPQKRRHSAPSPSTDSRPRKMQIIEIRKDSKDESGGATTAVGVTQQPPLQDVPMETVEHRTASPEVPRVLRDLDIEPEDRNESESLHLRIASLTVDVESPRGGTQVYGPRKIPHIRSMLDEWEKSMGESSGAENRSSRSPERNVPRGTDVENEIQYERSRVHAKYATFFDPAEEISGETLEEDIVRSTEPADNPLLHPASPTPEGNARPSTSVTIDPLTYGKGLVREVLKEKPEDIVGPPAGLPVSSQRSTLQEDWVQQTSQRAKASKSPPDPVDTEGWARLTWSARKSQRLKEMGHEASQGEAQGNGTGDGASDSR